MDLPDDVRSTLFDAGAAALRFNAPLSEERAVGFVDELARREPRTVVDLGCGRGELVRLVAARLADAVVVGVDTDGASIDTARRLATEAGVGDRVRFEIADAATWNEPVDAAICVGSSHAFGGSAAMLARLAGLVPAGTAVVGDGVWEAEPDSWCQAAFGELPDGAEELAATAEAAGWTVAAISLSTRAEWDAFEAGWVAGVRSVETPTAQAFAHSRTREYETHYRGVLGFCWLVLTR